MRTSVGSCGNGVVGLGTMWLRRSICGGGAGRGQAAVRVYMVPRKPPPWRRAEDVASLRDSNQLLRNDVNDQATAICIAILAVLAVMGPARLYWHMRRTTKYRLSQMVFYLIAYFFTKLVWQTRVYGKLAIRDGEGAILICNHTSPIDPFFIQTLSDRVAHWMVAKEYCAHPALAWIFRIAESIPVNRAGVDTAATKMAIRFAKQGDLVGLFPEGRINSSGRLLLPGRSGAALIAVRAGVPVIPCYVEGAPYNGSEFGSFFMTARVRVFIGEPIDVAEYAEREDSKEAQAELTLRFLKEIATLAGHPEFEPELAGRQWRKQKDPFF